MAAVMGNDEGPKIGALEIKQMPVEAVRPYMKNPRVITELAITTVANSIKKYGFRQPIVVDSNNVVVVGHTRLEAAKVLGLKEVPVHVAHDMTDDDLRAYRIADNKTGDATDWELEILASEMEALMEKDYSLEDFGFSEDDLASLANDALAPDLNQNLEGAPAEGAIDPGLESKEASDGSLLALTEVTIKDPKYAVSSGDIWRVGSHILLVCSPLRDWPIWVPYLDDPSCVFCPFPSPMVPLGTKAKDHKLVLVQPDTYIAGHLLDRYVDIEGEDAISKEGTL